MLTSKAPNKKYLAVSSVSYAVFTFKICPCFRPNEKDYQDHNHIYDIKPPRKTWYSSHKIKYSLSNFATSRSIRRVDNKTLNKTNYC